MSQANPNPLIPAIDINDKLALDQRLMELRRIMLTRPKSFQAPPGLTLSEIELAAASEAFDLETAGLIKEQLEIFGKMRRTSAGPAKKGGARAKKAPLDLGALIGNLMKAS